MMKIYCMKNSLKRKPCVIYPLVVTFMTRPLLRTQTLAIRLPCFGA